MTHNHRKIMDASEEFKQQQLRSIRRKKLLKKWGLRIGVIIALVMAAIVVFLYLG